MAERTVPEAGEKAPAFRLPDADGRTHALKDYLGRKVVLYFYPKDDTPGCTTEACEFRDEWKQYQRRGVAVLGVSPDPPERHARFRDKHELPFVLLSDPEREVMTKYGAWGEKTLYGRKHQGVIRSTFLIDERGRIARAWKSVKAKGHAEKVLAAIDEAGSE